MHTLQLKKNILLKKSNSYHLHNLWRKDLRQSYIMNLIPYLYRYESLKTNYFFLSLALHNRFYSNMDIRKGCQGQFHLQSHTNTPIRNVSERVSFEQDFHYGKLFRLSSHL